MARLRAVGAALSLLLIVGAVPVALALWGVPPGRLADLARPDDGSALLAVLTLLGWAAWLAFAISVLAEAVNVLGRRAVPLRIPLLGGLQSVAGALVFTALSAAVPATAAPPAPVDGVAVASDRQAGIEQVAAETPGEAPAGYLVRPGDDLWSVAEQLLGEGARWRLLADANPELLANPTVDLAPGVRLVVPELPAHADEPAPQPRTRRAAAKPAKPRAATLTVVVERGDTLSGLAEEHLGSASAWPRIFRANRDRIKDPDLIDAGWTLVIPETRAAAPKPAKARPAELSSRRRPVSVRSTSRW